MKEAAELSATPSPDYHAHPATDADLFDWHFTLRGPPSTPYANGIYHGRIVLPPTYPLRPPSFRFLTPSGRFEVNREICLSISGHHEETWQPAWGIRTALVALRAFMEGSAKGQVGGLEASKDQRERLAGLSKDWKCGLCMEGKTNEEILRQSEELCRELGIRREEGEKESVPEELKMGFKNERGEVETESDKEDAELAEGFVSTSAGGESSVQARPAQSVPQPTPTIRQIAQAEGILSQPPATTAPARIANAYPQHQRQAAVELSREGVPIWVDLAIGIVVLLLAFMVLRIMLGW